MINSQMPYNEIASEINADLPIVWEKKDYYERKFIQETAKARLYPVTKVYKLGNRDLASTYYLSFTRTSANITEAPTAIACKCQDNRGDALLLVNPVVMSFFQNHFIERYKERVMKDTTASLDSFVESFMIKEVALSGCEITKELEDVFHCFDGHFSEDKVDLLLTSSYGYSFAERKGKIVFVKTVITPEMLSDRQKELFFQLKTVSDITKSRYYGSYDKQPMLIDGWVGLKGPRSK